MDIHLVQMFSKQTSMHSIGSQTSQWRKCCINYKFRSASFLLLLVCAAGLCLRGGVLLLVLVARLSAATLCLSFIRFPYSRHGHGWWCAFNLSPKV